MTGFILIIITSLVFGGLIIRTKSLFSGRKGPGIMQPIKDIVKLLKKGSVYSSASTFIFKIAPTVYLASIITATVLIPFGNERGPISFNGDFVLFAYLLATGKFFMIIAALDTGSSFEGMGASRESLFSMFAEPAFFILMGSFSLLTGHTSFYEIFSSLHYGSYISYFLSALAASVLVFIAMIENNRMPIDDPKTHLELTMIHEVMVLDYSGFDLGLIKYASHLKFALYGGVISNLFLGAAPLYISVPVFLITQLLFAVFVGIMESFTARFRMNHNPQFVLALSSVALLIFFGVLLALDRFN